MPMCTMKEKRKKESTSTISTGTCITQKLITCTRALSGFKADFGPLLGTSNSPARGASENMKMFEFDLLYI